MRPLESSDPTEVGSYRILGELGSGGMGRVLLGAGPDGRLAAVKLVHAQFMEDPGFRARFRREVEASRRVSGAYTAAVIDADPDAPSPWLASAFVPGPSLFEVVAAVGGLPEEAVLRLAAGLATALTSIHRARLVHRDLKPSNVLLADDGPRVIDFGIARATDSPDTGRLTQTGWLVGSPGFMSPEQAQGLPVSAASDVFSLGAVLVVACTGRDPFAGSAALQIMYNVVHTEPDLTAVPQAIRPIVEACLAKTPAARPTPAHLLEAIGTITPSTRPWPPAVHQLIARQRAELTSLLGETDGSLLQPTPVTPTTPVVSDEGPDHSVPPGNGQDSPLDRAVQLAVGIADPQRQEEALWQIAEVVPDRAEMIFQHVASPWGRGLMLLHLAKEVATDPARAQQLIDQAEAITARPPTGEIDRENQPWLLIRLADVLMDTAPQRALQAIDRLVQVPPDAEAEPEWHQITELADLAARVGQTSPAHAVALITHLAQAIDRLMQILPDTEPDWYRSTELADLVARVGRASPARAVALITHLEQHLPPLAADRAWALARLAKAAATVDPDLASRLMSDAEESVRALLPEAGSASEVPAVLYEVIKVGGSADPQCAARLADLAEQSALNSTEDDYGSARAWALLTIACAVAGTDLRRAERLIGMITPRSTRGYAWGYIIEEAVASHHADVPYLLDAAEASVFEDVSQETPEESSPAADVGRSTLWQRLRSVFNGREIPMEDDWDVDVDVDVYAGTWDDLAGVAVAAAPFDAPRAESFVLRMAEGDKRIQTLTSMANAVAKTHPSVARRWLYDAYQAALGFSSEPKLMVAIVATATTTAPHLVMQVAKRMASLDKAALKRAYFWDLVQIARGIADADPAQAVRLIDFAEIKASEFDDITWRYMADALITAAAAWVRSDPSRSELLVRRAQRAALSMDSAEERAWIDWSLLATALVAQNPDSAEEFVRAIADDTLRAGALGAFSVAISKASRTATSNT